MFRIQSLSRWVLVLSLGFTPVLVTPASAQSSSISVARCLPVTNDHVRCVEILGDLRAKPAPSSPSDARCYVVLGHHNPGDAGGGIFCWDAAETASDNNGTILLPAGHGASGRWIRKFNGVQVSVKWFGAKGDGFTDDAPAIQQAISSLPNLPGGRSPIFLPSGNYICNSTITLPVSIQGLEIYGAGWTEIDDSATIITNQSSGPLFQTSGIGTCAFLKMGNFRLMQSVNSGYYFQFDNLTVHARLERIHCNMSNTGAGAVLANQVEWHLNVFEDMKVVTNGAMVPMFHIDGPDLSNITSTTFRRITINTPNSKAPQILVEHNHTNASVGFTFDTINIEQPDGGGIHLYGIGGATFQNCIASDTSGQTAPVFLFDKNEYLQAFLEVTMIQCHSFIGTETAPDIKMNIPAVGGAGPGPLNLIGGRYVWIDNGPYSINAVGTSIGNKSAVSESILRMNINSLTGVQGIQDVASPGLTNRAQNYSGFAQFPGSDTVTVTFDPVRQEPDTDYRVQVTGDANETFWVPDGPSKQTGQFDIKSSNPSSSAKVVWTLVRGV